PDSPAGRGTPASWRRPPPTDGTPPWSGRSRKDPASRTEPSRIVVQPPSGPLSLTALLVVVRAGRLTQRRRSLERTLNAVKQFALAQCVLRPASMIPPPSTRSPW